MLRLGLGALAHAHRHACYMSMENDRWPDLAVLQAAHAAEIIVKARIAQEHPLLLFDSLPTRKKAKSQRLELLDLVEHGRTIQWSELPERLWAAAGIELADEERFREFGKLRNTIQHFAAPEGLNLQEKVLRFTFGIVDPLLVECWGLCAVDYDEDYEPYVYFVPVIIQNEIEFAVSRAAAETAKDWDVDWSEMRPDYRQRLERRIAEAMATTEKEDT